jgi:hypothetical protein
LRETGPPLAFVYFCILGVFRYNLEWYWWCLFLVSDAIVFLLLGAICLH